MDGVSLLPTVRNPRKRPRADAPDRGAGAALRGNLPANQWDRPYKGVRTDRYTYVVYRETGEQELYDRRKDPYQLRNVAAVPAYARQGEARARSWRKLDNCRGRSCNVKP